MMKLIPPENVASVAAKALEMRAELAPSRRGGTPVGVKRASQLASRVNLTPKTIKRMVSFFARHEVDKKAEGFHKGEEGFPSKGRQAWDLWGGDPGRSWAEKMLAAIERGQGVNEMIDVNVLSGAFVRRDDGLYGQISKVSLPWVSVRWANGKTESFLRSDDALVESIELKTLDKGWISLGSLIGVTEDVEDDDTEMEEDWEIPADLVIDELWEAKAELRALRNEARLAPLKARLVEAAKKKAGKRTVKAGEKATAKLPGAGGEKKVLKKKAKKKAEPKSKATVKKAQAKKAAEKKAGKQPQKKADKPKPPKKPVKKTPGKRTLAAGQKVVGALPGMGGEKKPAEKKPPKKKAFKKLTKAQKEKQGLKIGKKFHKPKEKGGGGGEGKNPKRNPFTNFSTLGKFSPKKKKREATGYWSCKGNEAIQVCKGRGGETKIIRMWKKKAQYTKDYQTGRATGKYKLPNGAKKVVTTPHYVPTGSLSSRALAKILKSQKSKSK